MRIITADTSGLSRTISLEEGNVVATYGEQAKHRDVL